MKPDKRRKFQRTPQTPVPALTLGVQERLKAVREALSKFTIPLFCMKESGKTEAVEVFGSGTLLVIGDHRFLVTSAHVPSRANHQGMNLLWRHPGGNNGGYRNLAGAGNYFGSLSKDPAHLDDPIDIAVFKLPDKAIEELNAHYDFIDLSQLDPADSQFSTVDYLDQGDPSSGPRFGYAVVGFPHALSPGDVITSPLTSLLLGTVKHIDDLGQINDYEPEIQMALSFKAKHALSESGFAERKLPNPGGLSGGAIWRTIDANAPNIDRPQLVGIAQRWETNPPVIIGTQIGYVVRLILQGYPTITFGK